MKLQTRKNNVERFGIKSESAFTIKTTAKSFEILSSGLYTDPITAIIRELSCNAYDAHVAINNQSEPFVIHLPNKLEPYFSVTDYGIGLSDEQIQGELVPTMIESTDGKMVQAVDDNGDPIYSRAGGLYTTYFDSTKTDSNDFIGALGLGSKSPFSYTNAFEVTSCYNGTKSIYSIFLNESGIPSVALMGQMPTKDHTGLEVKITVNPKDFKEFKNKTAYILRYFDVKPTIVGYSDFQFDSLPDYTVKSNDWFVAPKSWKYNAFTAVQGNVPYTVNINQFTNDLPEEDLHFLTTITLVVFFDIGELDVAANREEIRYDDTTKQTILHKIKKIRQQFVTEIQNTFEQKQTDSLWENIIILTELSVTLFGKPRSLRYFLSFEDNITQITNDYIKEYIQSNKQVTLLHNYKLQFVQYRLTDGYSSRITRTVLRDDHIIPTKNTCVMFNDVKYLGVGRAKQYLSNNCEGYDCIILISHEDKELDSAKIPKYDDMCNMLGNPKILKVSDTPNYKQNKSNKNRLPVYRYHSVVQKVRNYTYTHSVLWDKFDYDDIKISKGGLYFTLTHGTNITTSNEKILQWNSTAVKQNFLYMIDIINDSKGTSYNFDDLVGMSISATKKIKKESNWFNIFDLLTETINDNIDAIQYYCILNQTENVFSFKDVIKKDQFQSNVLNLDDRSHFKRVMLPIIKKHNKYNDKSQTISIMLGIFRLLDICLPIATDKTYLNYDTFEKYKMFTIIGSLNNCNNNWDILFDYIKLIDKE